MIPLHSHNFALLNSILPDIGIPKQTLKKLEAMLCVTRVPISQAGRAALFSAERWVRDSPYSAAKLPIRNRTRASQFAQTAVPFTLLFSGALVALNVRRQTARQRQVCVNVVSGTV